MSMVVVVSERIRASVVAELLSDTKIPGIEVVASFCCGPFDSLTF